MNEDQILQLVCKKHIKVFKLSQLGLSNSEVAKKLGTNQGHVWNVLKKYKNDQALVDKANELV